MGCDIHFYVEKREPLSVDTPEEGEGAPAPAPDSPEWEGWATGDRPEVEVRYGWHLLEPRRGPEPMTPCDHTIPEHTQGDRTTPERVYEPWDCPLCDGTGQRVDYGPEWRVWHDEDWYSGRDYQLFGVLAGVRGDADPIDHPRGMPVDLSPEVDEIREGWGVDGHSDSYFTLRELMAFDWSKMGATTRYLSAGVYCEWKRLNEWGRYTPETWCGGAGGQDVEQVTADRMDEILAELELLIDGKMVNPPVKPTGDPDFFAGDPQDRHAAAYAKAIKEAKGKSYYVQTTWQNTYAELAGRYFWQHTMARLLHASGGDPDSIRVVFWFDN